MFQHGNAYSAGISGGAAADGTGQPWVCYGGVPDTSDSRWKWEIHFKSSGFYCLNEDGTRENAPAVHYFDHFVIDGTVFDGYYYHDENGKFAAGNPHMVQIRNLTAPTEDGSGAEVSFDGCYMVNNLGKLSASPQVRYMDNLVVDKTTYNGLYYFDQYGKMVTDPGIHYLEMNAAGQMFDGYYYFGGENGVLVQEEGTTPEGFPVDGTGKVETKDLGMEGLKPGLRNFSVPMTVSGVYM